MLLNKRKIKRPTVIYFHFVESRKMLQHEIQIDIEFLKLASKPI